MEAPTQRVQVTLPAELLAAAEAYRRTHRLSSDADAVRALLELGLAAAARREAGSPRRDPDHPALRAVGPEDEDRAGPEAPSH